MTEDPSQNELENLRAQKSKFVDAPTINGKKPKLTPKIKLPRSPWIFRSLFILLGVFFLVEVFLVLQFRKESLKVNISNPPPAVSYPTPEIYSEISPQIAPGSNEDYLPEPTEIPLPPELEGVDISYDVDE